MAKRILITGGAGFIGSTIADLFLEAGWDVAVLDDLSSGKRENVPSAARFYPVDVRSAAAHEVLKKERPQVVCHHAAQIDVRRSMADPRFDADVNIGGLLNLMQGAVEAKQRRARPLRVLRRRDLRRHRACPDARGSPAAAGLALRRGEGGERALPRRVPRELRHPVHRAPLLERVRAAPGSARRGGRGRDLLRARSSRAAPAPSTAPASRPATTSSRATSRARTCSRRRSGTTDRSTSAPGSRRT